MLNESLMKTNRLTLQHQFVERHTGAVRDEQLFSDSSVRWLYHEVRERAPQLFELFISARASSLLGWFNYDLALGSRLVGNQRFLHETGLDLSECVAPASLNTLRQLFERQIRYWEGRPLPAEERTVVSPADSRVLVGSLAETSALWLKGKFFAFEELIGRDKGEWLTAFADGEFALFRLTPDKYHYNHTPVAGLVRDIYEVRGRYHSCNPSAIVIEATPYSKNTRTVTVIDTDVPGGTGVGLVAMLEITALMIGEVVQCYSRERYDAPQPVVPGLFVERGCPKSLYRPGSSTDVLLFERGRVQFAEDLLRNQRRADVQSRFSQGFGQPLVETEVAVRSMLAHNARLSLPNDQFSLEESTI